MDASQQRWKLEEITHRISEFEASVIEDTPISETGGEDRFIWRFEKKGLRIAIENITSFANWWLTCFENSEFDKDEQTKTKEKRSEPWSPPQEGIVKISAYESAFGAAAIVMAVREGLKLAKEKEWNNVMLETDSKEAFNGCTNEGYDCAREVKVIGVGYQSVV
ncbi:hypothetical protein COLO4_35663 [Corchorus olitorius]|uniref:Uncharacterized protein n=1 Tax=Corchorus olitorius TaxID=93759 RepID=A0A1R3GEB2_9ROSI|nr:hypothetical protein COLO4_35663 [Corchorus olitorius]